MARPCQHGRRSELGDVAAGPHCAVSPVPRRAIADPSPPAQLLGYEEPPHAPTKMKKSISSSMLKDLPPTSPHLVVMNPTPSPVTDGSDALSSPQPSTPPGIHHARPRSFAGFAEWEVPSTPTSTRPLGTPLSKARQRLSCSALNELAAGNVTPRPVHDAITNGTSSLRIPQRPNGPRGSPARNSIILVQNEDVSNSEPLVADIRRSPCTTSPTKASRWTTATPSVACCFPLVRSVRRLTHKNNKGFQCSVSWSFGL